MDWLGFDMPPYSELENGVAGQTAALPGEWLVSLGVVLILSVVVITAYRRRSRAFWCALAGREVVVTFERGRVCSCTAFEDPAGITCGRRCTSAAFRRQWPPALPVLGAAGRGARR